MPATNAWSLSRFFSSPRCGRIRSRQTSMVKRRVVGVRTQVVPAGDRRGDALRAPGRPCPSSSRPGRAARPVGHPKAARLRRGSRARHRDGGTGPAAEGHHERGLRQRLRARRGQTQTAGEHQVDDDAIAVELEHQELAPPPHAQEHLTLERLELARRSPRMTSGWTTLADVDWPSRKGGVGGIREDVQVGQLGHPTHRTWYLSPDWRVVGYAGTARRKAEPRAPRNGGVCRAHQPTRTTSRSRKPGRAARALSSPGREPHHPRRCIHLTEPQQEETGTEPTSPTTIADETTPESVDAANTDEVSAVRRAGRWPSRPWPSRRDGRAGGDRGGRSRR